MYGQPVEGFGVVELVEVTDLGSQGRQAYAGLRQNDLGVS